MKLLVDTDVLVDHLRTGDERIAEMLRRIAARRITGSISTVTVLELHVGRRMCEPGVRAKVRQLLSVFRKIPVTESIAVRAGALLRLHSGRGLALADAIVAASALDIAAGLLTRNKRHFKVVAGLTLLGLEDALG